jgi:Domain of unknown function (DUF1851)
LLTLAKLLERFLGTYALSPEGQVPGPVWEDGRLMRLAGYGELAGRFAGCSFNDGMYRLLDAHSGPRAQQWLGEGFPEMADRARPFALDWLGRQFAVDVARRDDDGEPLVLLLEPGTGEALEVPLPFAAFHDQELVDYADAALAASLFAKWRQRHADDVPLPPDRCVGYRVPLFLGGTDDVDNLDIVDLDVYWSLMGQLRRAAMKLPPGTPVRDISSE